jgi:hypothetical protein
MPDQNLLVVLVVVLLVLLATYIYLQAKRRAEKVVVPPPVEKVVVPLLIEKVEAVVYPLEVAKYQSRHFAREDLGGGRFRDTIGLRPTHINKGAGWVAISNVLGATGDPNLTIGVDELVQFRIRPKLSGNAPVLHFGKGDTHVQLTPLGTANVDGVVSGNRIAFPGAWAGTGGYILELGGHIIRKRIPLLTGHPPSFAFRIDSHAGLNIETLETADFRILQPYLSRSDEEMIPLTWQKTTQGGKLVLTANLPVGNWAGWELDPTLTLQPDAAAGIDTYITLGTPTRNYGVSTYFVLSVNGKGLIKFDLSGISSGATCQSAVVNCYQCVTGAALAWTLTVYPIAVGNSAWIEGTRNNAQALAGEPCWNALAADGAGGITTAWAGTAGLSTVITDYEAASIGSFSGNRGDANGTEYSTALTALRVQTCFGVVNTNYGWLFMPNTTVGGLGSSDNPTPGYRPQLVVVYTLPGQSFMRSPMWGRY